MKAARYEAAGGDYPHEFRQTPAEKGTEARQNRYRILLVEDNEDTRDMLQLWLETDGYRVVTAGSGWEAVQLALNGRYDVILMDMSLPVMDGITAVHIIRGHERLRSVPVVGVTAYDTAYPRAEVFDAECVEYILKPIDFGRLERILDRLLGH
jgi:two-component system, sensor histidine kinase